MATRKRTRKPLTAEQLEKKRAYNEAYRLAHKEKLRMDARAYAATHREQQRAKTAEWHRLHPEETRARNNAYRLAHLEKHRIEVALWRAAHPLACRAYEATWRQRHPASVAAKDARRRARKAGAPVNDFTKAQWQALQEAYDHRCVYCGKRAKGKLTRDHLTPFAHGGSHTLVNILPACRSCNSRKRDGEVLRPVQPALMV